MKKVAEVDGILISTHGHIIYLTRDNTEIKIMPNHTGSGIVVLAEVGRMEVVHGFVKPSVLVE